MIILDIIRKYNEKISYFFSACDDLRASFAQLKGGRSRILKITIVNGETISLITGVFNSVCYFAQYLI